MKRVRSAPARWIKEREHIMEHMGKKVTVFGSFVVDLMGRTPHLPAAGEDVYKRQLEHTAITGKGCL